MLIMKFNKIIRNKLVWWVFGSIVIFSFVAYFGPNGGCEAPKQSTGVGSLDGEMVTDNEFRQARFNTYLGFCLSVGRVINVTPRLEKELREQAWKRIAALRAAREMNLTATPAEVLAILRRDPQFQSDAGFSKQRYQVFCKDVLGTLNASVAQFEEQLAENIILQKLHNLTSAAVWVSPDELKRMASRYADSFRVDYVNLSTNLVKPGEVKLTDADLQSYYTRHTNDFVVPPKVAVNYVRLPASNYLAQAMEKVDTNTVADYYTANSDEFSTTDTNGVKVATPVEEVAGVISNRLIHEAAIQLARDAANELADALIPDREGRAPSFESVVAKAKLPIFKTELFDAGSDIPGIDADLAFNKAAFRLRPTAEECFSDAVPGKEYAYLMTLGTNTEAYVPAFEVVKNEVESLALAEALEAALAKKAQDIHASIKAGLAKKQSFSDLAREKALNVSTSALFSVNSAPDALSSSETLNDITLRNAGELSDVVRGTDGLMIAYVVERRPAAEDELSTIQNQVATSVIRRRARILFGEWQNWMVSGDRKKDTQPPVEIPESGADDLR
jgi:hypothetical protein